MDGEQLQSPPSSYHVFLSFTSQEESVNTFTDHLYTALEQAGFSCFRQEDGGTDGQKAIQESKVYIVVLSENYARSRSCLDELAIILERKRGFGHYCAVLPVFYRVDPSDFRKLRGKIGEALNWIEENGGRQWKENVKKWKQALMEVADVGGMILHNQANGHESKFIQKILRVVENKLSRPALSTSNKLIGIHRRTENINSWLQDRSTDVDILVICGMGGIGKTTVAKYVFNLNYPKFERSSFLANVRDMSKQPNGLVTLQRQLLYDILGRKKEKAFFVDRGINEIIDAVSCKKLLLVLDDVDQRDQLDALFGMRDWFYPGSKIIVTTRDKRLFRPYEIYKMYELEGLNSSESIELLSWHAFGQHHPHEGYLEYAEKVASQCGGLPLALEVIGSSLAGRDVAQWESTIKKLEVIPNHQILKKLRISYESLEDDHDQNLFLHIACFFVGMDREYTVTILNSCDFYTVVGIQNLIDRNLVKTNESSKLTMHQIIQNMGREIVHQESPVEPGKRSRLWRSKDSFNVLLRKSGTKTVQGMILDMDMLNEDGSARTTFPFIHFKKRKLEFLENSCAQKCKMQPKSPFYLWNLSHSTEVSEEQILNTDAFVEMHRLRLLHLSYVRLIGSYETISKRLRWLFWLGLQLKCLPAEFSLESIVVIELRYSRLKQVWQGTKSLRFLKILDLSHSYDLLRTPDFSGLPSLEKLMLQNCVSLVEVHETIGFLEALVLLNLKNCKELWGLPDSICMLKGLVTLNISGCSNLEYIPMDIDKMDSLRELYADGTAINQEVSSRDGVRSWHAFLRSWVWKGRVFPKISPIFLPNSLVTLSLANSKLSDDVFPIAFSNLSLLEHLDLGQNRISCLPNSIKYLTRLLKLEVESCESLKSLVGLPNIEHLNVTNCWALEKISYQSRSSKLKDLILSNCIALAEIEGNFKLEPLENTDVERLWNLGLLNFKPMENVLIGFTSKILSYYRIYSQGWIPSRKIRKLPPQGVSQPGMFSTFLPGEHVPCWFSSKFFTEPYTSIRIPFLHNSRVKGLSFCVVYKRSKLGESKRTNAMRQQLTFSKALVARQRSLARPPQRGIISRRLTYRPLENKEYETTFDCPCITVENVTRCSRWSRQPVFYGVPDGKEGMMWLSHWRFGRELSCDDGVEVSVSGGDGIIVKEFGVKVLYLEEEGEGLESSMVWVSESCRERGEAYGFSVRLPPTYRSLRRARESYLDSVPH
ncbi:PREDICTED: disease resistance protein RML1A-like [Ipomoea nil]|uniref:disease resistance protein RML1A-like n=1 Tax=Ipomoea nil TaxID=35883 RepID=UPI000901A821|nr:PREDICTED: disease resistance protein RML1A-like [Ipomoea nil]